MTSDDKNAGPSHETEIALLKQSVDSLKTVVTTLVTRLEFAPIKLVVYCLCGCILTAVIGAIISKVLIK